MHVAFLAMSNHIRHTHSSDFFIALLRDLFGEVTVIPHERAWIDLPKAHWDLVIDYQKRYSPEELEAFGADRMVLVPMYDDCPVDEAYWSRYRAFKVLCFSSTLGTALSSYGLEALGARYYPEVPDCAIDWKGLRGFFWPRLPSIDWSLVEKLVAGTVFERMQLHGDQAPEPDDPRIERSSWFADQAEYRACLERANVYFAPRPLEGIGLSFIEAMAMGHCVVAPDRPTMNEYIRDGENGLLYDPENPRPLDFSRARELGRAARESCVAGRKAWLEAAPRIRRFFEEPARGGYAPKTRFFVSARGKLVARLRFVPGLFAFYRLLRSLARRIAR
jgi:glycosyltransferase involved in cell wall biosynthesis